MFSEFQKVGCFHSMVVLFWPKRSSTLETLKTCTVTAHFCGIHSCLLH